MAQIESFSGEKAEIECIACAREQGKISSAGFIARTKYFCAEQDFEIPIPGFVIVSARRHILSVADFTESEQKDFIKFVCKVRKGMKAALNIKEAYLFQNEDSVHHFHLWMFPRFEWMEKFGRRIQSVRPIMEYARENLKTKENIKLVEDSVEKMKKYMGKTS